MLPVVVGHKEVEGFTHPFLGVEDLHEALERCAVVNHRGSALQAAGEALDEPLLREQEQRQDGNHGDDHYREDRVPLGDQGADVVVHGHRQRLVGGAAQEDQRREEVVPHDEPGEDGDRSRGRGHHREHHLGEDLRLAGTVDGGRFFVVRAEAAEEVGVEEDRQRQQHARVEDDQAPRGSGEAQGPVHPCRAGRRRAGRGG